MSALTSIAKALNLPTTGQDWGIEHADPTRLGEFLDFAQARQPDHPYELELLAELIFQSAEEAYDMQGLSGELQAMLVAFVQSRRHLFPATYKYWRALPETEWHVPSLLRGPAEA